MLQNIHGSRLTIPISGRDHIQGPIEAPVALLEYGDYECPYCGEVFPVIKAIQQKFSQEIFLRRDEIAKSGNSDFLTGKRLVDCNQKIAPQLCPVLIAVCPSTELNGN
jgi:hypothetical protein